GDAPVQLQEPQDVLAARVAIVEPREHRVHPRRLAHHDVRQDRVLAGVVGVEGGAAQPGAADDGVDGGRRIAVGEEQLARRLDQPIACGLSPLRGRRRSPGALRGASFPGAGLRADRAHVRPWAGSAVLPRRAPSSSTSCGLRTLLLGVRGNSSVSIKKMSFGALKLESWLRRRAFSVASSIPAPAFFTTAATTIWPS